MLGNLVQFPFISSIFLDRLLIFNEPKLVPLRRLKSVGVAAVLFMVNVWVKEYR